MRHLTLEEKETREEARNRKLPRYYTGVQCIYGHMSERWTANGQCIECKRISDGTLERVEKRKLFDKTDPKRRKYNLDRRKIPKAKEARAIFDKTPKRVENRRISALNCYYKRYMEDPQFKIKCLLRARLKSVISRKKKVGSFVRDLGCTVEEVQGYIESHENWSPEWTWKNWGTL